MCREPQRVVVIQDASRELGTKAIKWALKGLSLKPGDELIFFAILHHVNNPSTFSFTRAAESLGYWIRVDSNSKLGANQKIVDEVFEKRKKYYSMNTELEKVAEQYKAEQIKFHVEIQAGPPELALETALSVKATWIILDRHMKKEYKKRLEKISCGILSIKSDNKIEQLRRPILRPVKSSTSQIGYNEMVPGSPEEELSVSNYELDREHSLLSKSQGQEEFKNSVCPICNNKRPRIGWKKDFNFAELIAATDRFSDKNYLSEGGFGAVFRGELHNGMKIAVKQHKYASQQGQKEFTSEVSVLSKARHENLVMLLGSCSEGNRRFIVYEYVCNGSLDQHLSEHSRTVLSWEDRIKIALGAAKGLLYLHENNIIHRDMRPNNILVTHDYEPLLGDFGLARKHEEPDRSSETRVVGTFGYLAPEYAEYGKVSTKTDVYSFGVVLLQLITGLKTTDKRLDGNSLVGWARPLLKDKKYPDLIDKRIINSHDYHQLFWMIRVAEKCLSKNPKARLSMTNVVNALTHISEGNTLCGIRDYSPAHSDSIDSFPDSPDSEDSMKESTEPQAIEGSFSVDPALSHFNIRHPPSPPVESSSYSSRSIIFTDSDESTSRGGSNSEHEIINKE